MPLNLATRCLFHGIKHIKYSISGTIEGKLEKGHSATLICSIIEYTHQNGLFEVLATAQKCLSGRIAHPK